MTPVIVVAKSSIPAGAAGIDYTNVIVHCAADGLSGLSDNDPITSWTDLTGNGFHLVQSNSDYRPTYKTNTINGKPSVRFGTNKWFVIPSGVFTDLTAISVIVVVKIDNDPPGNVADGGLWHMSGDGGGNRNTHWPYTDGTIYDSFGVTARVTVGNPATTLAQWNSYIVTVGGGTANYYLNNSSIQSASRTYGVGATLYLGRTFDGYSLAGNIAEFALFNTAISESQRNYWHGLMDDKYAFA